MITQNVPLHASGEASSLQMIPPRPPSLSGAPITGDSNEKPQRFDPENHYLHQQRALALGHQVALSSDESIFVSSAGDVIVSRCRSSNYPLHYQVEEPLLSKTVTACQKDVAVVCCEVEDLNEATNEHGICGAWGTTNPPAEPATINLPNRNYHNSRRGGLLGGSPAAVGPPPMHHSTLSSMEQREGQAGLKGRTQMAFHTDAIHYFASGYDEGNIAPIKSFDCTHLLEQDDDQAQRLTGDFRHEEKKSEADPYEVEKNAPRTPPLLHGIPTFLSNLSQVKVTQVSAHPLGSHVLLIAEAGLLYAYGRNDHGQLGLGKATPPLGAQHGFIMTPTIVTPLIENGGKAIACAAGVSHSLVVVMTEERRLIRAQTQPYGQPPHSPEATESLSHHQLYGFGRNDYMKIGLVSPKVSKKHNGGDEMESVLFPRRAALRCRVPQSWQQPGNGLTSPPPGIFSISASQDHSAALVHRSTGDVELYTWGNAMSGALGLPQQPAKPEMSEGGSATPVHVVPVPSFVASLSRSSNADASTSSLLMRHYGEYPISVTLGKQCSFVSTSMGRSFSFGSSTVGMLGLGDGITQAQQPQELSLGNSSDTFLSVSAGAEHVVALGASGAVYSWGALPQNISEMSGSPNGRTHSIPSTSSYKWTPRKVDRPSQQSTSRDCRWKRIVAACAGHDSSAFVVDSGHVFSSGKSSGRLGLGETTKNAEVPMPFSEVSDCGTKARLPLIWPNPLEIMTLASAERFLDFQG
eukprot:CAMPEP_0168721772 /NCGR_PEP_ID=MMETSP0724-20121128/2258_1 /TAXON_ID=265536 /ORGANISM="Amphiprora sp., Strain CCMP467" /LENGTH=748 /DNA_ID=CAMNT_0008768431 /DNA_START=132 /DNA_END=2379 /DNA_ORIENTATION=-